MTKMKIDILQKGRLNLSLGGLYRKGGRPKKGGYFGFPQKSSGALTEKTSTELSSGFGGSGPAPPPPRKGSCRKGSCGTFLNKFQWNYFRALAGISGKSPGVCSKS